MSPQNKIKKYLFSLLLINMLLMYGNVAYAQQNADYTKSGVQASIEKYLCAPTSSTSNNLYTCINTLYKFAIAVASAAGVLMIVIAGYFYMSSDGNQEAVDKAKSIVTSTITSLVILFAGYLILKTLNPDLIAFQTIQPESVTIPNVAPSTGGVSEDAARQMLSSNGIGVNAQPPQTTLGGMQTSTLNTVVSLKQSCNCQVTVTGGTEPGHATTGTCNHESGYKVDLATNSALDNYITTQFTKIQTRSDGAEQWKSSYTGAIYAKESTHWDISVCP